MKFVAEHTSPDGPLKFPALMQSVAGSPIIVLFTTINTGLPLREDGFGPEEGGWIAADNKSEWTQFTGTIKVFQE